jgi:hypothetical protein
MMKSRVTHSNSTVLERTASLAVTLKNAPVRGHIVEFYVDSTKLAKQVADFAEIGLRGQEGVVLIATREHLDLILNTLTERHFSVKTLEKSGQLKYLQAQSALDEFIMDGNLYWKRFESTIGTSISLLANKYGKVRAYGEMVNILWQKGLRDRAIELEGFWNRLAALYPFCLFCAYSLNGVNAPCDPVSVTSICRAHSHFYVHPRDGEYK